MSISFSVTKFYYSAYELLSPSICIAYTVVFLRGVSSARRISNPFKVRDAHSAYFGALSCDELLHTQTRQADFIYPTISDRDFQQMLEMPSKSLRKEGTLPTSEVYVSSSNLLDVEVPLPSTYLMSLSSPEAFETTNDEELGHEQPQVTTSSDQDPNQLQNLHCQQKHGIARSDGAYWDQERSMNAVIVIMGLFLAIVLLAEVAQRIM